MKKKIIQINPINIIAIDPDKPEEMNDLYPYMHNLFVNPNIYMDEEHHNIFVLGLSDHMDENDQNPVHYAGMLAKMIGHDTDLRNIDHIYMINFVRDGIPDPEGAVEYFYKGKTITFPGKSGKYLYQKNVDVSMIYIDRYLEESEETDPKISAMINKYHQAVEEIYQKNSYINLKKEEEEYQKEKLSFWKDMCAAYSNRSN